MFKGPPRQYVKFRGIFVLEDLLASDVHFALVFRYRQEVGNLWQIQRDAVGALVALDVFLVDLFDLLCVQALRHL